MRTWQTSTDSYAPLQRLERVRAVVRRWTLPAGIVIVPAVVLAAAALLSCTHHCKSNGDCPAGDSCRATSDNINAPMACAPCETVGRECTRSSDCCSGSCPTPTGTDVQLCVASADAGPELSDGAPNVGD